MDTVNALSSEIREAMRACIAGEISEEDSARLIILLQCEIISELTKQIQDRKAA